MLMKLSRKAQLWLADRHSIFDKPGLYRRSQASETPTATGWDAVLLSLVSLILLAAGMLGLGLGVFLIAVVVSTWFG
jgi:hypothetical protein